jgi:hypothetical protein
MSTGRPRRSPSEPRSPAPELVLAAVERAGRHRGREPAAAPWWAILAHLAIAPRSSAARSLRALLDALVTDGALVLSREHGVSLWALSPAARARMLLQHRRGEISELPESPQHGAWRAAVSASGQEIARFRARLGACLQDAGALLASAEPPDSDTWLELAERLQRSCWLLASATHCLYEWPEPDDAHADLETGSEGLPSPARGLDAAAVARRRARRAGLRNIRLWREAPESEHR